MHPSSNIDREYLCRVLGEVDEDRLNRLRSGVQLDDGIARFTDISEGGSDESAANRWYYVCLMEGRNREVRRLWESQNVKVSRLKRVRYGPVFLPARLKQGQWQDMPAEQVGALYDMVSLKAPVIGELLPEELKTLERQQRKNRPAVSLSRPPHKAPAESAARSPRQSPGDKPQAGPQGKARAKPQVRSPRSGGSGPR